MLELRRRNRDGDGFVEALLGIEVRLWLLMDRGGGKGMGTGIRCPPPNRPGPRPKPRAYYHTRQRPANDNSRAIR